MRTPCCAWPALWHWWRPATARHRLHLRETSVPRQEGDRTPTGDDPLLKMIVANLPLLDDLLKDGDPKIRLAMLNVLFWLDEGARVAARRW